LDEIEIALPNDDGDDYELIFNEGPTKEQVKAAAEEVRKDALADVSNQRHMQFYKKVKSMLTADTLTTTMPEITSQLAAKEFTKKKISKVHNGAKEVHWKCLQVNKKGQQQVQGLVQGRECIYGENKESDKG
jgi:hypothetical protein